MNVERQKEGEQPVIQSQGLVTDGEKHSSEKLFCVRGYIFN